MAIYTVHAPAGYGVDVRATGDKVVFVRDGFYVWALIAALIWLVWHRLWLALIGYIAISITAELLFKAMDVGVVTRFAVMIVFAVLMGFEAGTLWRWTLSRGKWRQVDIVSAANEEEAERKFFSRWANTPRGNDIVNRPVTQPLPPTLTVGAENDVLGSFPNPGAPR
ncbi:MAG: DUF2628 domain-containing protein [Afipia sp.]|nr:DUF2628 domain-containing protein [Afipia sp.]